MNKPPKLRFRLYPITSSQFIEQFHIVNYPGKPTPEWGVSSKALLIHIEITPEDRIRGVNPLFRHKTPVQLYIHEKSKKTII